MEMLQVIRIEQEQLLQSADSAANAQLISAADLPAVREACCMARVQSKDPYIWGAHNVFAIPRSVLLQRSPAGSDSCGDVGEYREFHEDAVQAQLALGAMRCRMEIATFALCIVMELAVDGVTARLMRFRACRRGIMNSCTRHTQWCSSVRHHMRDGHQAASSFGTRHPCS